MCNHNNWSYNFPSNQSVVEKSANVASWLAVTFRISRRNSRDREVLQSRGKQNGRRRFQWQSNLWNALKTSKDVYQTSRFFAMRRGQGACKFPTTICILRALDSVQLRRWTSGTRFRGRDGGQCTTPAAPSRETKRGTKGREESGTRGRGINRRGSKIRRKGGAEVDSSRRVYATIRNSVARLCTLHYKEQKVEPVARRYKVKGHDLKDSQYQ